MLMDTIKSIGEKEKRANRQRVHEYLNIKIRNLPYWTCNNFMNQIGLYTQQMKPATYKIQYKNNKKEIHT